MWTVFEGFRRSAIAETEVRIQFFFNHFFVVLTPKFCRMSAGASLLTNQRTCVRESIYLSVLSCMATEPMRVNPPTDRNSMSQLSTPRPILRPAILIELLTLRPALERPPAPPLRGGHPDARRRGGRARHLRPSLHSPRPGGRSCGCNVLNGMANTEK